MFAAFWMLEQSPAAPVRLQSSIDRPVDALATSNERVLAAKVKFANRT